MILLRLKHVELPSGAAPGTVALRVLEIDWSEDELRSSDAQETFCLLKVAKRRAACGALCMRR